MTLSSWYRKSLQILVSILTGVFLLDLGSEYTGLEEVFTDMGWRLIIGGFITIVWIFVAYMRRHPEFFSDYYE